VESCALKIKSDHRMRVKKRAKSTVIAVVGIALLGSSCGPNSVDKLLQKMENPVVVTSYSSLDDLHSRFNVKNVRLVRLDSAGEFAVCFCPTSSSQLSGMVIAYQLTGGHWVFQAAVQSSRDYRLFNEHGSLQIKTKSSQVTLKMNPRANQ